MASKERINKTKEAIRLLREIYSEIGPAEMGKEEKDDIARSIKTLEWHYNRMDKKQRVPKFQPQVEDDEDPEPISKR